VSRSHPSRRARGVAARERRWVVPPPGAALGALLQDADGAGLRWLAEGRVFVDRVRVTDAAMPLAPGVVVTVAAGHGAPSPIAVLGQRGGLLAVAKPAGIPTEPDRRGANGSLVHQAAAALGIAAGELHAANRLDVPVSGIVVLAQGSRARGEVERWRGEGRITRRYLGLAAAAPSSAAGEWASPIRHGAAGSGRLRPAASRFATVATAPQGVEPGAPGVALLTLRPLTGRTHQLRIHAAGAGAPLLGDAEQHGPRRLVLPNGSVVPLDRVALHAARLSIDLPGEPSWEIAAPLPPALLHWWDLLGGNPEAWSIALDLSP
jgi:23S rRNA-/tRNA-specific pseudouridylate synthase